MWITNIVERMSRLVDVLSIGMLLIGIENG